MQKAFWIVILAMLWSCADEPGTNQQPADDFNRQAMLQHWADGVIIPQLSHYQNKTSAMVQAARRFDQTPDRLHYRACQDRFEEAYLAWQGLGIFDIGAAETHAWRNRSNLYPCDTTAVALNIDASNAVNYALPSTFDEQGWPAMDWLLHGTDSTQTLKMLQQDSGRRADLIELAALTDSLALVVKQDWQVRFRDVFIQNDGSSATASVNKLVNDFIFYFERMVRAGKVGIPAGVFSANPLPQHVEAPYAQEINRGLLLKALRSCRSFYRGQSFDGNIQGPSLYQYLSHLGKEALADKIDNQFLEAIAEAEKLPSELQTAVRTNNQQMLKSYDAMQKVVILIKVDMMQALNIRIDYVDADGD